MPLVQGFPTWKNMNAQNSTSSSGQTDNSTGAPYYGDGLYPGVYADLTNSEAANSSDPLVGSGILYSGRYRWVGVDSGATAANITTGTIGYIRAGSVVKSAITTNVGSGLTNGVFQIPANIASGGGAGAVLQVSVAGGVIVGNPVVIAAGFGYVSAPSFNVTAITGGSAATVSAQLSNGYNTVTSYDQAVGGSPLTGVPVHPVVFLNAITPGNYGFIQELGTATVLGNATQAQSTPGSFCNANTGGTITTTASSGSPIGSTIGVAIDAPVASGLFKVELAYACVPVQD